MAIHFACTQCGKCCHGLRITLSVDEAIAWAGRGHQVQILTEALPWAAEPAAGQPRAEYDRARSFPALSGDIPFRIAAILVATHEDCPNLLPDKRCARYEERPRTCRLHPLDSRPFTAWTPEQRLCPPEAWDTAHPVLEADGAPADPELAEILADHRRAVIDSAQVLGPVCEVLGLRAAAFANEGLAVHTPPPRLLADTLQALRRTAPPQQPLPGWTIVSNRNATCAMLHDAGCDATLVPHGAGYLGVFADEPEAC